MPRCYDPTFAKEITAGMDGNLVVHLIHSCGSVFGAHTTKNNEIWKEGVVSVRDDRNPAGYCLTPKGRITLRYRAITTLVT